MTRSQGARCRQQEDAEPHSQAWERGGGGKWISLPFFISRATSLPHHPHQHSTNQDMIKVSRCCQPCISSNSSIDFVTNDLATLCVSVQSQTNERHHDQLTVRPRSQTQTKSSRQSAIERDLGKGDHRRRRTPSRHTLLHFTNTGDR